MAPQQIVACGVAACMFATVASVTGPGQDVASGVRCVLTVQSRLDELEAVGNAALKDFRSVQGPEHISQCTTTPDVAVAYYLHGDPRHPRRWRSEVHQALDDRAVLADDQYEVTAWFPVPSGDGYVLPITVSFAGHPRFQLTD